MADERHNFIVLFITLPPNQFYLEIICVSTISFMLIGFYCMFFSKKFYGLFFMISTAVLIISNIVFIVLIYFDSAIGYTFYFALIAAINFLNALYLKCNIIPEKKSGRIEYVPMIFELIPFVCMVISLYSVFCTFPTLEVNEVARAWEYYDLMTGMKLNMVSEVILIFAYFLCRINNAEIIRDNMFDEQIQE